MRTLDTRLTFGSLFTGIGGIDLGFEKANMICRWQVEINEYASKVLEKHWPHVLRFRDVRECGAHNLGEVDVIVGGFPCKQTSNAAAIQGKRIGLVGNDSGLWWEQLRIIREMRPKISVTENVSGAKTWDKEIKGGLEGIGYNCTRIDISAGDLGAPHLRKRVFYVAYRDIKGLAFSWKAESSSTEFDTWRAINRNAWMSALARVLRVDDGVPGRLDRRERIIAVGNAVSPVVAEYVANLVVKHYERNSTTQSE